MAARLMLVAHAATSATKRAAFPRGRGHRGPGQHRAGPAPGRDLAVRARIALPADGRGAGPAPTVVDGFADLDAGRWAGADLPELMAAEPESVMAWMTDVTAAPHGGESLQDLISAGGWRPGRGCPGWQAVAGWPVGGGRRAVGDPGGVGSSAGRTEFAALRGGHRAAVGDPPHRSRRPLEAAGAAAVGDGGVRPGVVNARGTTVVTDPFSIVRQGASAWLSPSSTATAIRMVSPWLTSTIWSVASRSPISGDASSATILRATSSRDSAPVYRTAGSVRSTPASLAVASRVVRPSSSPRDCSRSSGVGIGVSPRTGR